MTLRSLPLAAAAVIILFGAISAAMITGNWKTEASKTPSEITDGEYAGLPDPADLRGSYSFAEAARAYRIDTETLLFAFGFDPRDSSAAETQVRVLEERFGGLTEGELGTDSVRLYMALATGLPFSPQEDTKLPLQALDMLRQQGAISEEEATALRGRSRRKLRRLQQLSQAIHQPSRAPPLLES